MQGFSGRGSGQPVLGSDKLNINLVFDVNAHVKLLLDDQDRGPGGALGINIVGWLEEVEVSDNWAKIKWEITE